LLPDDTCFRQEADLAAAFAINDLIGGSILNVVRRTCIRAMARGVLPILEIEDIGLAIRGTDRHCTGGHQAGFACQGFAWRHGRVAAKGHVWIAVAAGGDRLSGGRRDRPWNPAVDNFIPCPASESENRGGVVPDVAAAMLNAPWRDRDRSRPCLRRPCSVKVRGRESAESGNPLNHCLPGVIMPPVPPNYRVGSRRRQW